LPSLNEDALRKLGWQSNWFSRVGDSPAISARSNYAALELSPINKAQAVTILLVAWPDPSSIHVEFATGDGSSVSLSTLREILRVGEMIFMEGFVEDGRGA
jgi:hypothetical protein